MRCIKPAANASIACMMFLLCLATLPGRAQECDGNLLNWVDVASSADGTRLVAADRDYIYISPDGGLSWSQTLTINDENANNWKSVASSVDGVQLVAVDDDGGLYTSSDSGISWNERLPPDNRHDWESVASSADGMRLIVADDGAKSDEGGQLYTSTDGGVSWTPRESNREWTNVASSSDGLRLVATSLGQAGCNISVIGSCINDDDIFTSSNGGISWTRRVIPRTVVNNFGSTLPHEWTDVASSSDGLRLVAVDQEGQEIHVSTDAGESWRVVFRRTDELTARWRCVASSFDGTRLVAGAELKNLYTSVDGGATWLPRNIKRVWTSVSSSADGMRLVAVDDGRFDGGLIYTSTDGGVTWTPRDVCQQCGIATWISAEGGAFDDADNWEPAQVPGSKDTISFNLVDSIYPVSYTSIAANRLFLDRGLVLLRGSQSSTLVLNNENSCEPDGEGERLLPPSLELTAAPGADFAGLSISGGGSVSVQDVEIGGSEAETSDEAPALLALLGPTILSATSVTIGGINGGAGELVLELDGEPQPGLGPELRYSEDFTVGPLGDGSVSVRGGRIEAEPSASGATVGSLQGTGTVELDGGTADFGKGLFLGFSIGTETLGNLFLKNDSLVQTEELVAGLGEEGSAAITVEGGRSENPDALGSALSVAGEFTLGEGGDALLALLDGARMDAGRLTLGQAETSSGEISVLGGASTSPDLGVDISVRGPIVVGEFGLGTINASEPTGTFNSDSLVIGAAGSADNFFEMEGGTADFGDIVTIGLNGRGDNRLELSNEAQVSAKLLVLGQSESSRGTLRIDGTAQATQMLVTGGAEEEGAIIGESGHGRVELLNDARLEVESCQIGAGAFPSGLGEVILGGEEGVPVLEVKQRLAVGEQTNGLLAVLGTAGGVKCEELLLGGSTSRPSGGTINLANSAILESSLFINIGVVGPGLMRVDGLATVSTSSLLEGGVIVFNNGLVLLERGALLNTSISLPLEGGRVRVVNQLTIPGAKQLPDKQSNGPARITGKLDLAQGGTLDIEATGEGMLLVEGGAKLGGTLNLLLTPGATYTAGQTLQPLQIQGEVTGAFEQIRIPNASPGFAATPTLENGIVTVTVTQPGAGTAFPPTGSPLDTGGEGEGEGEGEGGGEGEGEGQPGPGCNGCQSSKSLLDPSAAGEWLIGFFSLGVLMISRCRQGS